MPEDLARPPVVVKLPAALVRLFPEAARRVELPGSASVQTVAE